MKRRILIVLLAVICLSAFAEVRMKLGARELLERDSVKCYETQAAVNGDKCKLEVLARTDSLGVTLPAFKISQKGQSKHNIWPKAMPVFGGGVARFSAELESTRTSYVEVESNLDSEAALADAVAAFMTAGWSTHSNTGKLALLGRGNALAALMSAPAATGSRVVALQRLGSR